MKEDKPKFKERALEKMKQIGEWLSYLDFEEIAWTFVWFAIAFMIFSFGIFLFTVSKLLFMA